MGQTKKDMLKRVEELEKRVKQLEEERQQAVMIKVSGLPEQLRWPTPSPIVLPTWSCDHEFPSHYYSPDGYYPCVKCGKSFMIGTVFTCCTTTSDPESHIPGYGLYESH